MRCPCDDLPRSSILLGPRHHSGFPLPLKPRPEDAPHEGRRPPEARLPHLAGQGKLPRAFRSLGERKKALSGGRVFLETESQLKIKRGLSDTGNFNISTMT